MVAHGADHCTFWLVFVVEVGESPVLSTDLVILSAGRVAWLLFDAARTQVAKAVVVSCCLKITAVSGFHGQANQVMVSLVV